MEVAAGAAVGMVVGKVICTFVIHQGCKYAVCKTVKHMSSEKLKGKRREKRLKVVWSLLALGFGNFSDAADFVFTACDLDRYPTVAKKMFVVEGGLAAASIAEESTDRLYHWKPEDVKAPGDFVTEVFNMDDPNDLTFNNMGDRLYSIIRSLLKK